jgi:hypothetical protein
MAEPELVERLREWCERNLDTESWDGMRGAKERVEAEAARLGLEATVRWERRPNWHPTLQRFEGAGWHPNLDIHVHA